MGFQWNGVDVDNVLWNGAQVEEVQWNGVLVWAAFAGVFADNVPNVTTSTTAPGNVRFCTTNFNTDGTTTSASSGGSTPSGTYYTPADDASDYEMFVSFTGDAPLLYPATYTPLSSTLTITTFMNWPAPTKTSNCTYTIRKIGTTSPTYTGSFVLTVNG
mgnify:CR=1 FL=1